MMIDDAKVEVQDADILVVGDEDQETGEGAQNGKSLGKEGNACGMHMMDDGMRSGQQERHQRGDDVGNEHRI